MEIEKLANIEITDEDILWVEEMMGGKVHFDSARVNVLKNMDSVDIQAFPGSGKTTILVAKLAILAKKWPYSNAGICVLSHTNVAREEIEERLGKPKVAQHWEKYIQLARNKYNASHILQMQPITPHILRHTYCTNMARAGMNPKTLQYLMGHSDISITLNVYTHLGYEDAALELERLQEEVLYGSQKNKRKVFAG